MCSEITVRTQLKTVKLNYSFFTVIWTSILPYIVQCRSVDSSLQLLHCTWSSNQMKNCKLDYSYSTVLCTFLSCSEEEYLEEESLEEESLERIC